MPMQSALNIRSNQHWTFIAISIRRHLVMSYMITISHLMSQPFRT